MDLLRNSGADDALSRVNQLRLSATPSLVLDTMAQAQMVDPDVDKLQRDGSLNLAVPPITAPQNSFFGGVSQVCRGQVVPATKLMRHFWRYTTSLTMVRLLR